MNLSDLNISSVLAVDETFLIDVNTIGPGISSHQFQIISGNDSFTHFYYPDDQTTHSKKVFEKILKKFIQGLHATFRALIQLTKLFIFLEFTPEVNGNFKWLQPYKNPDFNFEIDFNIASNRQPPKNRESKFREELDRRKQEYTLFEPYKIYCTTWNVNLQVPDDDLSLRELLATTEDPPDIYAVGLQEIDMSADTILRSETKPDYNWIAKIMEGVHPGDVYEELATIRLVGMMLTIVIKKSLRGSISKISSAMIGTGTLRFGNKGGVGVSFQLNETLICFVNSHLAAHVQEYERRNQDHDEILRSMQFNDGFRTRNILEHGKHFFQAFYDLSNHF